MRFIDFREKKESREAVKALYETAFPKDEKVPYLLLRLLAGKRNVRFYGIYEEDSFVGLTYLICQKDLVFLFYFAVNDQVRGQGYGSRILRALQKRYGNQKILLSIEPVDENSDNYAQRVKRKEFYQRNGFFDLNYTIQEADVEYEMLCWSRDGSGVDKETYLKLIRRYLGRSLYHRVYVKQRAWS